jgi:hypothetical protein
MDVNTAVNNITQENIDLIISKVSARLSTDARIKIMTSDISTVIREEVKNAVKNATPYYDWYQQNLGSNYNDNSIINALTAEFKDQTQVFLNQLTQSVQNNVINSIYNKINDTDLTAIINDNVHKVVSNWILKNSFNLPAQSIPGTAVNTNSLLITADNIKSGTVKQFNSTGIVDNASSKKIELTDELTVIDNKLVVNHLHVTGSLDYVGTVSTKLLERIATITLDFIERKLPTGKFDFLELDQLEIKNLVISNLTRNLSSNIAFIMNTVISDYDIRSKLQNLLEERVNKAVGIYQWPNTDTFRDPVQTPELNGLLTEFKTQTDRFLKILTKRVQEQIFDQLSQFDLRQFISDGITAVVKDMMVRGLFRFPDRSITGISITSDNLLVKAENIIPGMIKQFESAGIQDRATQCQLSILNDATIIENKLVTKDLEVMGTISFKGQIDPIFLDEMADKVIEKIEDRHDQGVYDQYAVRVIDLLNETGISANKVFFEHGPILENTGLHSRITESNLQHVGQLKELQVVGESLFAETVYVGNRRMGINTRDPEKVLDIWDHETQIVIGKRSKNLGMIGTPQNQQLLLSSNFKNNLLLKPDGSVTVEQLHIGNIKHTSGRQMPSDNHTIGNIVWNENPYIGGPIGWVSLGGARWASFGTILDT